MASWVPSGVFILAVLIWGITCVPLKKDGGAPSSSFGSGSNIHSAADSGFYNAAPSSSGFLSSGSSAQGGASNAGAPLSFQPEAREPSYHSSGNQGGSSAGHSFGPSFGSGQYSAPSQPGSPPGGAWHVAPNMFSVDAVSSSSPASSLRTSPPLPPPGPEFVPGEMSRYESTTEEGVYESETQEPGSVFASPQGYSAVEASSSPLQPGPSMAGGLYYYPYPYDYMFLTGQYPVGTFTHYSSSLEQGRDHWDQAEYERFAAPSSPGGAQQVKTLPSDSTSSQQLSQYGAQDLTGAGENVNRGGAGSRLYGGYMQPTGLKRHPAPSNFS